MLQEATEQVSLCMTLLSIFQTCFLKQSCLSCEDGLHFFFSAIYLVWLKANICAHFTRWFRLVYISDMCFHYSQFSQPAEAALQESRRQKASTNVEKRFPTAGIYWHIRLVQQYRHEKLPSTVSSDDNCSSICQKEQGPKVVSCPLVTEVQEVPCILWVSESPSPSRFWKAVYCNPRI